ncbi:MAG: glycosyltransferase [Planctomycetota bacterium]
MADRRPRILVAISDFVGGGAERELCNLLHFLEGSPFDFHLCVWRPVFDYKPPASVPVHVMRKFKAWHIPRTIERTRRLIDDLQPDLVFSHLPCVSATTGAALLLSKTRPRWIARLAGNPIVDMPYPQLPIQRAIFQRADIVAGCSAGVADAVVRHLQVSPSRVRILPNVVARDEILRLASQPLPISKDPECFTIVNAGRFTEQKNQQLLLRAFAKLRGQRAELWMLGKGPLGRSLKQLARELEIEAQVRWLGFLPNPYPLFRAADCFVLSSNHEGLPNVLIEALLCGTTVISTDCPFGPSEIVRHGINGFLIPPGDVDSLAKHLSILANDRALRQTLAESASKDAERDYHPSRAVQCHEELFREVLFGRRETAFVG